MANSTKSNTAPVVTENRKHQRLPIEVRVRLQLTDQTEFLGETINLSFSGAYVKLDSTENLPTDANCTLTLILQDGHEPTLVKFKAKIIHIRSEGVGLQFKAIFAEDYNEFVYLMVNNSPDPDGLLAEVAQHPGIKMQNI